MVPSGVTLKTTLGMATALAKTNVDLWNFRALLGLIMHVAPLRCIPALVVIVKVGEQVRTVVQETGLVRQDQPLEERILTQRELWPEKAKSKNLVKVDINIKENQIDINIEEDFELSFDLLLKRFVFGWW